MAAFQKTIGENSSTKSLTGRKDVSPRLQNRRRLVLAAAALGALAPCGLAFAQTTGTAVITTANGGVTGATVSQPDFSNTNVVNWEDFSNNTSPTTAPFIGGPGQTFLTGATGFNLNSVTVKGAGSTGHNGSSDLSGNWTITIGSVNGTSTVNGNPVNGNPYWGAPVTILDTESAVGTPIASDVASGTSTNYDQFTLQNQIALNPNTYYFFAITSNNATNTGNAWYAFAKSQFVPAGNPQVTATGLAYASAGSTLNDVQNNTGTVTPGAYEYTYFLNGSLVTVSNNTAVWAFNGNGNWETASNWTGNAPPATSASTATFGTDGGAITTTATVTLTAAEQVSTVTFSSPLGYVLTGSALSATGAVVSTAGSNSVASLGIGTATVSVSAGSTLTVGSLTHAQYSGMHFVGGGVVNIGTITDPQGDINVSGGTTVNITGAIPTGAFIYDFVPTAANDTINVGSNNTYDSNAIFGNGTLILGPGSTLGTAEFGNFNFFGSLSGSGTLDVGTANVASATNGPFTGTFSGQSLTFSGPITVAYDDTLGVANGAVLGDASAANTITLDSGKLQAIGTVTVNGTTATPSPAVVNLAQNITIEDTLGLVGNVTTINTESDIPFTIPPATSPTGTMAIGNTLTLSGHISGPNTLMKTGIGTLILAASNTYGGGTEATAGTLVVGANGALPANSALSITNGALVQLATGTGGETLSTLSIDASSNLDIGNNHLIINYGSGTDPIASIAALLSAGFNGGAWNGAGGITSSAIAANPGYSIGYADSADTGNPAGLASGTLEVKFTLIGDATLGGIVNGIDFGILAANFNKGVSQWDGGDFYYHGIVNGIDFGGLAANFNKGASSASDIAALDTFAAANGLLADVPEPASLGLLALATVGTFARRRRR